MHFTVHLRGDNTYEADHSYGLVFIPNPKWLQGDQIVLDMKSAKPGYQPGSVRALLKKAGLFRKLKKPLGATILVHRIGLGTKLDYMNLIADLEGEGFETTIFE
jgi:hypothetical protein